MPISFRQIPQNIRVPGVYVEIDSPDAGSGSPAFRSLLVGQKLASGTADEVGDGGFSGPYLVPGAAEAARLFGEGSMLAAMCAAFLAQNPLGTLYGLPLADSRGGTKAARTVTLNGAAAAAGTIALYVGGRRIPVAIVSGDTAAQAAAKVKTAIDNAGTAVPATAAAAGAVVTITARHAGAASDLDVRTNHLSGEALPQGLGAVVASTVAGAGDPALGAAFDVIDDSRYDVVGTAYSDAAGIGTAEAEMVTRWQAATALDGIVLGALRGTVAAVTTLGMARNSQFSSLLDAATSPSPLYEVAAAYAGAVALTAAADPALPPATVPLLGIVAPRVESRRDATERQTLLQNGVATHTVDAGGTMRIDRAIMTYQTVGGADDDTWLDITTPLTLSYLRQDFAARMRRKYGQSKVAGDEDRRRPGQKIATPRSVRAETVAWFTEMYDRGLVEGEDAFRQGLVVERPDAHPTRIDILQPVDLVNPLYVLGVRLDFRL